MSISNLLFTHKRALGTIAIYFATFVVIFLNITMIKSSIVGFVSSIIYVYISSVLCGALFFRNESRMGRIIAGFGSFIIMVSLGGTIALILYRLSNLVIVLLLLAIAVFLVVFNLVLYKLKTGIAETRINSDESNCQGKKSKPNFTHKFRAKQIAEVSYITFATICFVLLLISRSDETVVIWDVIHPWFLPTFLIATFALLSVTFSSANSRVKLSLVVVHSFIVHGFLLIVLSSGFVGDIWRELAFTRDIFEFGKNVPNLFEFLRSGSSPFIMVYYLLRKRVYGVLITVFTKMFSTDLYWVQMFLVPSLWGSVVPFSTYKILRMLGGKKTSSILAAFLSISTPTFVWWGAVSVPDTLSVVLYCFFIYVTVRFLWLKARGVLDVLCILMAVSVTFLSHFKTGLISFSLLFLAFSFKKFWTEKQKSTIDRVLLIVASIFSAFLLPLGLFALYGVYPGAGYMHVRFSIDKLITSDVWSLVFGNYVNLTRDELLLRGLVPFFGIIGLIYATIYGSKKYRTHLSGFLLLAVVILMLDYRVLKFCMENVPFTVERIWIFRDLLLVPFAAIAMVFLIEKVQDSLLFSSHRTWFTMRPSFVSGLILLISCLLLSGFAAGAIVEGYSVKPTLNPTPYEIAAIEYIHTNTPERYVVICDPIFKYLGEGILGFQSRGTFTKKPFYTMLSHPSVETMTDYMTTTGSSVAYFVISIRYQKYISSVVAEALEIFDVHAILDDGKLYIFSYPIAERDFVIHIKVVSEGISRVNYPVEYDVNWTRELFAVPGGHLDSNSVRVLTSGQNEVPSRLDFFQAWFDDCSSTDNWSEGTSDGDVLTYTVHYTEQTPELRRLIYTGFMKEGGDLAIDVTRYKYMEVKWKENIDGVVNIRTALWTESSGAKTIWAKPTTQWQVWRRDLSFLNGSLWGLHFDLFDDKPGDWVGDYELHIDWIRFVSDVGTVRFLYNSTANSEDQFRIEYDLLENTESGKEDGLPEKPDLTLNGDDNIPPPKVYTWSSVPLSIKTIDSLNRPLDGVTVELKELNITAKTGADGWAHLTVSKGQWTIIFSEHGAISEKEIKIEANSAIVQRLSLIVVDGIVFYAWQFILCFSLIIIGNVGFLLLLYKKTSVD